MDEIEERELRELKAAYARVRVCGDVRRHEKSVLLEEIEQLEREALDAYEARLHMRDASG